MEDVKKGRVRPAREAPGCVSRSTIAFDPGWDYNQIGLYRNSLYNSSYFRQKYLTKKCPRKYIRRHSQSIAVRPSLQDE